MGHPTFPRARKIIIIIHLVISRITLYRLRLSFHPIIILILAFILLIHLILHILHIILIILILLRSVHFIIQLITHFNHIRHPNLPPPVIRLPFIIDHPPNSPHCQSTTIKLILLIN